MGERDPRGHHVIHNWTIAAIRLLPVALVYMNYTADASQDFVESMTGFSEMAEATFSWIWSC